VSYSLPRFVTTVGGAAVAVDLVDVFTTAFTLVFAFFGGMVYVFCADVRSCERVNVASSSRRESRRASAGDLDGETKHDVRVEGAIGGSMARDNKQDRPPVRLFTSLSSMRSTQCIR
jgi:hypothetical protein